jgi:hypothetical protein
MSRLVPQRSTILAASCLIFGAWLAVAPCVRAAAGAAPAAPKAAAPASVPEFVSAVRKLFDPANAGDWVAAARQSTACKDALKKVQADLAKSSAAQQTSLTQIAADLAALDTATTAKTRQAALLSASRIFRGSGALADTFINKVPQPVWQMEYLAHDLLVWSADPADLTKLKALPAQIEAEFNRVGQDVAARGGDDLALEFVQEMTALNAAATAADFAKLAKPLLDTLDKIEKAYSE